MKNELNKKSKIYFLLYNIITTLKTKSLKNLRIVIDEYNILII